MANIVPRDEELFKKIEQEHIQVPEVLWNVIYQYIGDPIVVINLLVRSYADGGEILPKDEAKKILDYTKRMLEIMEGLYHPESISVDEKDQLFKEIKAKDLKLDAVTDYLFRNYVRNALYMINLIVGDYVDPLDEREGVSIKDAGKILEHIRSIMHFMDRLRVATARKEAY
ncbi:MAG: hypothetical protein KKE64_06030 [Candidatus Omnitrophica bacterium]|nr:hypothetical protein [Candidatus Omnitrophota bacterium]